MGTRGGFFARRIAPLALVGAVMLGSGLAWADAASDLDAAESAYAQLDYDNAMKLAEKVAATKGLSHEQLVRVYRLLAKTHAVLGKSDQAADDFQKLLAYSPDEKQDNSMPPKVQDAFSAAMGYWAGFSTKPGIEATTVALRTGYPGTVRVRLHDPTHLARKVVVAYRWGASGPFSSSSAAPQEVANIEVPAPPGGVTRLDYYAQALDDRDDAIFQAGDASTPKTAIAEVSAGPGGGAAGAHVGGGTPGGEEGGGGSIFSSPVFWIITGVVVAGAATGAYFALHKTNDSSTFSPLLFCGPGTKCR